MTSHRQTRSFRVAALALGAALSVLGASCGSGSDADEVSSRSGGSTTSSTSEATTSTTTSSTSTTEVADTDADTDADVGEPAGMASASSSAVSVPARTDTAAQLTDVRVASHDGYDRVVFEFDGDLPGYEIAYVDGPVREDGSGTVVDVDGSDVLVVRTTPASAVELGPDTFEQTYSGPERLAGPASPVVEVVEVGDFEAQLTWAIGVQGRQGFVVSSLGGPTRLVIDVAR